MDNQRIFLWAALAVVLWLNYTTWQRDYAPPPLPPAAAQSSAAQSAPPPETLPELPSETSKPTAQSAAPASAAEQPVESALNKGSIVRVVTDVLSIDISTRGGELTRADLLKYALV